MPIDFTVHKRLLTREEKRKISNAHKKTGCAIPEGMDYVSFMKNDIYDEFVIFKCTKCGDEYEVPYDLVCAYLEYYKDEEYPIDFCKKCRGTGIPLDVYNKQ